MSNTNQNDIALAQYIQRIHTHSRLTREEEKYYAECFEQGRRQKHRCIGYIPGIASRKLKEIADIPNHSHMMVYLQHQKIKNVPDAQEQIATVVEVLSQLEAGIKDNLSPTTDSTLNARRMLRQSATESILGLPLNERFYDECFSCFWETLRNSSQIFSLLSPEIKEHAEQQTSFQDASCSGLNVETCTLTRKEYVEVAQELADLEERQQEARDTLLEGNLGLVVKIAHSYRGAGLPLSDLVQEGNIGLIRGIQRYNPKMNCSFGTYASYWIRCAIREALSTKGRVIRLPRHRIEQLRRMQRTEEELLQRCGHEPDDDEMAKELELSTSRVRALRKMQQQPISLQAPAESGDQDSTDIGSLIPDTTNENPTVVIDKSLQHQKLMQELNTLQQRDQKILQWSFGLNNEPVLSLHEMGRRLNLSTERVRQLKARALQELHRLQEQ